MFDIIIPSTELTTFPEKHYRLRCEVLAIAKEMGVDREIQSNLCVQVCKDALSYIPAAASILRGGANVIVLHPLWFVDWNTPGFPEKFKINNPNDPRLADRNFVQAFSDYLVAEYDIDRCEVGMTQIVAFTFFATLRNDPNKAKQAWRCMIGHELGHLEHNHLEIADSVKSLSFGSALTASTIASVAVQLLFNSFPIATGAFALPMLASLVTYITKINVTKSHEEEADQFAAKRLPKACIGAKYGFNCLLEAVSIVRSSSSLTLIEQIMAAVLFSGNEPLVLRFTHGNCQSRINTFSQGS